MIVRSNILTRTDICSGAPADVWVEFVRQFTPRRVARGFQVYLEGLGERHRRSRNGRPGKAATWDDHGVWMARLFLIDPDAFVAYYDGVHDFMDKTTRWQQEGSEAPWLEDEQLIRDAEDRGWDRQAALSQADERSAFLAR